MVRLFRQGVLALWAVFALAGDPALAGIDQGYPKEEGRQSWGEIFGWTFGREEVGKAYALIVGISQYKGFKDLEETSGDPERMRKFLLNDAGFDYVHVLTDEKVTRDRLRTLIQDEFRERVGPDDRFVLYWSGHGVPVEANSRQLGYLPLTESAESSIASMLAMRDLLSWAEHVEAKQALHVLDTCFSGLARLPTTQKARRDLTVDLLNKSARHLLTATTGSGQTIASREWAGGIFTEAFIAGARGDADRSGDGVVNMLELEDFVRDRVNAKRSFAEWPDEIKPKSYDLQENAGEFFFITSSKKREVARVDEDVAIEAGMPIVLLGPGENAPINVQCDAVADVSFWESIRSKTNASYFEAYLERVDSGDLCGRFAALARIELERLRQESGDGPVDIEAPVALSRELVIQIQGMLKELGFDPGTIDGDFGPRTRSAVAGFQRSINAPATGQITEDDQVALAKAYSDQRSQQRADAAGPDGGGSGAGLGRDFAGSSFRDCPECPEMVVIPAGSFVMGSPDDEEGRDIDEAPRIEVTIPAPFALGRYEITRAQFRGFVSESRYESEGCRYRSNREWLPDSSRSWENPGFDQGPDHPATCISWNDAKAYVRWLNNKVKKSIGVEVEYRLPSEAEWEYSARGGVDAPYFWGDDPDAGCDYANGHDNSVPKDKKDGPSMNCSDQHAFTARAGTFRPNAFGLYDMSGNVWEWVEDSWQDEYTAIRTDGRSWEQGDASLRVLRGGAWFGEPRNMRSANRNRRYVGARYDIYGFRVARTLAP